MMLIQVIILKRTKNKKLTISNYLYWIAVDFKFGLLPSKKNYFIYFNESPSKMMKNAFHFILKAFFFLKIVGFLL